MLDTPTYNYSQLPTWWNFTMAMCRLRYYARRFGIKELNNVTWIRKLTLSSSPPHLEITDDDIKELPQLKFPGTICLIRGTQDEEKYQKEINELCQADVLGFDTETQPDHNPNFHQPPCLIQLATENVCVLWRIRKWNMGGRRTTWLSSTLTNILMSPSILKVGHASTNDAIQLLKHYLLETYNIQDTFLLATQLGLQQLSLRGLVGIFLGHRLSKRQCNSNWESAQLKEAQISYACADAWASFKVYQALIKYMEETEKTKPHAVDRAWNLLKPNDQRVIMNKLSEREGEGSFGHRRHFVPQNTNQLSAENADSFIPQHRRGSLVYYSEQTTINKVANYSQPHYMTNNQGVRGRSGVPMYEREEYERKVTRRWTRGQSRWTRNANLDDNNTSRGENKSSDNVNNENTQTSY